MKVVGLDGRQYTWKLAGGTTDDRDRSSYHLRARALLRRIYPTDRLLEELSLPGCLTVLSADFFLALRRLMVEVQGEQHYKFCPHFHGDRMGYLRAKGRDIDKRRWCEINNIRLVEFSFRESDDEWAKCIRNTYRDNG